SSLLYSVGPWHVQRQSGILAAVSRRTRSWRTSVVWRSAGRWPSAGCQRFRRPDLRVRRSRAVSVGSPPARRGALAAGAGLAFGAGARRRARGRRHLDPELGRLEAADLVAQPRRLLELQVRRGVLHLGLELGDVALEVHAGERQLAVHADVDRDVVVLGDVADDVADRLLDALG